MMVWSVWFNDGRDVTIGHEALDGDRRKIEYVDATRQPGTWGGVSPEICIWGGR